VIQALHSALIVRRLYPSHHFNNTSMNIQTYPPLTVLCSTHQTTMNQLDQFGPVVAELYAEAGRKSFINGPLHWIYKGMDGNPETVFTLDIAIPVRKAFQSAAFEIKELDMFKAITFPLEGKWEHLCDSHVQIMQTLAHNRIPVTNECREVFLNINFQQPEKNITEIQIGIDAPVITKSNATKQRLLPFYF
jgi:hypothetical protein